MAAAQSLKARALQWLAQREHSRVELRRKLLRLVRQRTVADAAGADPAAGGAVEALADVDALLDWLTDKRYLSNARFVESRVNARVARYGNVRIRQELKLHGAALDSAAIERLNGSELARAQAVWARKYGDKPTEAAAERSRQMRFLAGRGFSADVIRRVVRGGEAEPGEHG